MTDNEKYVKRGQALIVGDDPQRHEEVAAANRNKVSAPFQYAESLFAALAVVKSMTGLPYRHLQGMLIETLGDWDAPCYTTIYRRFQSLEVKRNGNVFTITGGRTVLVRLAVDSTGLKQHNRGEWIRHKWKVRRGFVKIHVMVDVDTKKILAVRVTDDRTGDSPMLIPLLDDALENCMPRASESGHADGSAKYSAYGDGAYASRDNLKACRDRNVTPFIKLKVSSTPKGKGAGDVWGMAVRDQFGGSDPNRVKWLPDEEKKNNQKEWKASRIRQEMDSGDRVFCIQENVWRAPVLIEMEEHGSRGQSQGGRLQQADRHGSRGNVESDGRIQCKPWVTGLNYATGYVNTYLYFLKNEGIY